MDKVYEMKLEQAAIAPDSAFPDLLFEPITNDFDDIYFKLDEADYRQNAVREDPRFTQANIRRMSGSTKRIDRYLEWTSLWDDYMDYLTRTYGSVQIAYDMFQAGMLPDPFPRVNHRPMMKGKLRKMLKSGVVASYTPVTIEVKDCYKYLHEVCVKDPGESPFEGTEEPDIEWAMAHSKGSKEDQLFLRRALARYRRQRRVEILNSGTAANGITSNMDFIDNYYTNMNRGAYDTEWSDRDGAGESLTAGMKRIEDRKYRHLGQVIEDQRRANGESKYIFDGGYIRDRDKMEVYEIYKAMAQHTGIDIMGTLAHRVSKKRFKAIRTGMQSMGMDTGLTKKERKKLKKQQEKLERHQGRIDTESRQLADVLLNNKVFMNGGTVRFEDLNRNRGFDDDDY